MKEYLSAPVRSAPSPLQGRNDVREYLQTASWEEAVNDVSPFLGPGADPGVLGKGNIMRLASRLLIRWWISGLSHARR